MFKRNEGLFDRVVRVTLGLVLLPAGLFLLGGLQGSLLGLVAAGLGMWVLITGIIGVCPMYIPLGINTLEKEKELVSRFGAMTAYCQSGADASTVRTCCSTLQPFGKTQNQQEPTTQDQVI